MDDDRLFWALVILGVLMVIGASYYLRFLRQKRSTSKKPTKASAENTAIEVLKRFNHSDQVDLQVVPSNNVDESRSSDLDTAAAAEKALSSIKNHKPKS